MNQPRHSARRRLSSILAIGAALWAPTLAIASDAAAPVGEPLGEGVEFFERRVRPLLVEHCQKCHGAKKQEAGLRLDSRAAVLAGGDSGPALAPGQPNVSRLIKAIGYADSDLRMPPDKQLPAAEIATLSEWIRIGAPWPADSATVQATTASEAWKKHWAAQSVRPQTPPATRASDWIQKPVDRFVLSKLEQAGLAPSPRAERRALLRRATFDLVGLPPTPAEIAAFESDQSPEAFATVVERLLASPHYGERWGRHWLDVARYADTKEYVRLKEERRFLYAYTYRDYVIRAFNDDLPYNQFIVEQLAADLLPSNEPRRPLEALGFLTLGRQFTGNPHDIIDDRIDVTTRGLLGLTVTCARCHDHKYDPIPTADYYSLYGVFANSETPATPPLIEPEPTDVRQQAHLREANSREAALARYQDQAHKRLLDEFRSHVGDYLAATLTGRRAYLVPLPSNPGEVRYFVAERWLDYLESAAGRDNPVFAPWRALADLKPGEDFTSHSSATLQELRQSKTLKSTPASRAMLNSLEAKPVNSMTDVAACYGEVFGRVYQAWRATQEIVGDNLLVNGSFEQDPATENASLAGWTLSGSRFCTLGSEGVTEGLLAAVFADGTPQSQPPTAHTAVITQSVAVRAGVRYRLVFDSAAYGSGADSHAQTLIARVTGAKPLAERAITANGTIPGVFAETSLDFTADSATLAVSFADGTLNGENGFADSVLDNVRLFELDAAGAPKRRAAENALAQNAVDAELLPLLTSADSPTSVTPNDAVDFYLYEAPTHDKIMELRGQLNAHLADTANGPPRAHAMFDRAAPAESCVLLRGDPARHGPRVPRQFLAALSTERRPPFGAGSGRLELARAIASRDNPLTARVLVNRVWRDHFGEGLVRSPSNFGLRADAPTHPELLDYLAERFMAEGWSLKKLHRWIMLSATYQQSSKAAKASAERDPENRLLGRMNRRRLDFESLRDAMIATTGRLDLKLYGPPLDLNSLDNRRRSVYGLLDRQNLASSLGLFDFASPDTHSPARHESTVPQQALFLLNSPWLLAQSQAFAERTDLAALKNPRERAAAMIQSAFGRPPSAAELKLAVEFVESGGSWAELAQVYLVSNEFSHVD